MTYCYVIALIHSLKMHTQTRIVTKSLLRPVFKFTPCSLIWSAVFHTRHDKHKTTTAGSKIPATETSWIHPSPAKWRTGKNICPLCANAWKMMSLPPAFLLLSHIQSLLRDEEITFDPANNITSLVQDRSGWRKIVVTCSTAEWWWWWLNNSCEWYGSLLTFDFLNSTWSHQIV